MNSSMTKTEHKQPKDGNGELSDRTGHSGQTYQSSFSPRFDIWEGEGEFVLYGDLPGVDAENLDIEFENCQLTIDGMVCCGQDERKYLHSEYSIGNFHRTFAIDETVDGEAISAELRNGVLTIHLPKVPQAKPRRIEVKAS